MQGQRYRILSYTYVNMGRYVHGSVNILMLLLGPGMSRHILGPGHSLFVFFAGWLLLRQLPNRLDIILQQYDRMPKGVWATRLSNHCG